MLCYSKQQYYMRKVVKCTLQKSKKIRIFFRRPVFPDGEMYFNLHSTAVQCRLNLRLHAPPRLQQRLQEIPSKTIYRVGGSMVLWGIKWVESGINYKG